MISSELKIKAARFPAAVTVAFLIWASAAFSGQKTAIWLYFPETLSRQEMVSQLPEDVNIRYYSRALQALSVDVPADDSRRIIKRLQATTDVISITPVGKLSVQLPRQDRTLHRMGTDSLYGVSYKQLDMLGIPRLHALGFHGEGVRAGLLDEGFKKDLPVFSHILDEGRFIGEYDFVYHDSITADEADEGTMGLAQSHGTETWSVIGAYLPGFLMGGAWKASFALAKTEDMRWELPIEEDNFVAGMEWMADLGIDVISISLNYMKFDDGVGSYTYSQLDGRTTAVARICNWAAARGMIIVQAMGNEGREGSGSLWSPADAPSVISVGSVGLNAVISDFSGRGPTADGRIKPDVVALGDGTQLAYPNGDWGSGRGTSFSTPLIASGVILLKQMHPEWTVYDMLDAFAQFSSRDGKDNDYGWGIPDFAEIALGSSSPVISPVLAWPNPVSAQLSLRWTAYGPGYQIMNLYNLLGRRVDQQIVRSTGTDYYSTLNVNTLASGVYFVQVGAQSVKFVKL